MEEEEINLGPDESVLNNSNNGNNNSKEEKGNTKSLDIFTISKDKIFNLYSNKWFRKIFMTIAFLLIIYSYSNVDKLTFNGTQSVNPKKIASTLYMVKNKKYLNNYRNGEDIEIQKGENNTRIITLEKRIINSEETVASNEELSKETYKDKEEKKAKDKELLAEFLKSKPNKNARVVRQNDKVKFKIIVTDKKTIIGDAFEMSLPVLKNSKDPFSRYLIGKKVGEVVDINMNQMLKGTNVSNGGNFGSSYIYLLKILEIEK